MADSPSANSESNGRFDLSIGVISVGDTRSLRRCLARLAPQIDNASIEVLVPFDSTMHDVATIQREFPAFTYLDLGVVATHDRPGSMGALHELFDRRASQALHTARGRVISLLQDWGAPDPDWCRQVIASHELPHAAIGGAVEHEGRGLLNWAVYFQDFGRYELPLDEGSTTFLSDVNVAYKRLALDSVRELWQRRYNEVTINWTLLARGETLWRNPRMIVRQDRGPLKLGRLLVERASWGRLFGAARAHATPGPRLILYILGSPLIPLVLIGRAARKVFAAGRHRREFLLCLPALFALTCAWSLGELVGYVTRRPSPVGEHG